MSTFHLVGFSLGAQMSGVIGRTIQLNGFILPRITGLEPAGPFFSQFPSKAFHKGLSSMDAAFVDSIHTDTGFYGTIYNSGHVDFFPNGGRRIQPGCSVLINIPMSLDELCSHFRSWVYWIESLQENENKFLAAPMYLQYLPQYSNRIIEMGVNVPKSARGRYSLTTGTRSPFALGLNGVW
ncbi:hypothetical protein ACFFRR_010105 [Megaselia abdita]